MAAVVKERIFLVFTILIVAYTCSFAGSLVPVGTGRLTGGSNVFMRHECNNCNRDAGLKHPGIPTEQKFQNKPFKSSSTTAQAGRNKKENPRFKGLDPRIVEDVKRQKQLLVTELNRIKNMSYDEAVRILNEKVDRSFNAVGSETDKGRVVLYIYYYPEQLKLVDLVGKYAQQHRVKCIVKFMSYPYPAGWSDEEAVNFMKHLVVYSERNACEVLLVPYVAASSGKVYLLENGREKECTVLLGSGLNCK